MLQMIQNELPQALQGLVLCDLKYPPAGGIVTSDVPNRRTSLGVFCFNATCGIQLQRVKDAGGKHTQLVPFDTSFPPHSSQSVTFGELQISDIPSPKSPNSRKRLQPRWGSLAMSVIPCATKAS